MFKFGKGGPPGHAKGNAKGCKKDKDEDMKHDDTPDTPPPGMPDTGAGERHFSYDEGGLAYNVRVFEEDGVVRAEITVLQGSMDLNAVYSTSNDYTGPSANLGGPLNMNGGGSRFEGESVSWEDAVAVSQPGLGPQGQNKFSFLMEGDSLIVDLNADSVEDVDLIGIRATSVNGGNSIKGVSGNPEIKDPEDPMDPDPEDPEDPMDPDPEDPEDPEDPMDPEDPDPCPPVLTEWNAATDDALIDSLVLHYKDCDGNIFNVKVEMADFQTVVDLDDSYFAECLADLNSYLQGKEIEGIEPPACIAGLTVIGGDQSLFFEFNNSGLTAEDVDPDQVDYDLLEEDGQTFFNFDFALQNLAIHPVDSSDCGCHDDEDEEEPILT